MSGTQFKVEKGLTFEVDKIDGKEGSTFKINNVLLLNDNGKIRIGKPLIEGAYVQAKLLTQSKGDKVLVYKMKAKKRYRRTRGFRPCISKIEILEISATGGEPKTELEVKEKPAVIKKPAIKKVVAVKKPTVKKTVSKEQ